MILWTLFSLMMVLGVKYYTATQMRRQEFRLETAKNDLQQAKDRRGQSQDRQKAVESEKQWYEGRVQFMRELIQDIQYRLARYK